MNDSFAKVLEFPKSFKGTFHNAQISVRYVSDYQGGILLDQISSGEIVYSGAEYKMLLDISDIFKFRFLMVQPDDGEFGQCMNNKWTGNVGLLVNKDVDISVDSMAITHQRFGFVSPTAIFHYSRRGLLSAEPGRMADNF